MINCICGIILPGCCPLSYFICSNTQEYWSRLYHPCQQIVLWQINLHHRKTWAFSPWERESMRITRGIPMMLNYYLHVADSKDDAIKAYVNVTKHSWTGRCDELTQITIGYDLLSKNIRYVSIYKNYSTSFKNIWFIRPTVFLVVKRNDVICW